MLKVQKISEERKRQINVELKPYGVEVESATINEGKAWVSLNRGCAATYNCKKLAYLLYTLLKGTFTAPSAIVLDGREYSF